MNLVMAITSSNLQNDTWSLVTFQTRQATTTTAAPETTRRVGNEFTTTPPDGPGPWEFTTVFVREEDPAPTEATVSRSLEWCQQEPTDMWCRLCKLIAGVVCTGNRDCLCGFVEDPDKQEKKDQLPRDSG